MISNTTMATITPVQYSGTGMRSILFVIGAPHVYGAMKGRQGRGRWYRDCFQRFSKALSVGAIAQTILRLLFRGSRFLF